MAEQTPPVVETITTPENPDTTANYIEALEQMRQSTVSKQAYEKLQNENKQLLESLVRGGQVAPQTEKPKTDIEALRKELLSPECNLSNLEYWSKTLEVRDALIERGERDPFVPYGQKIAPTAEDVQKANLVAEVVRECIDYAQGDSRVFTNELNRRTVDVAPTVGNRRQRR